MWQRLRSAMPPMWHSTRIENRAGGGVPDVHMCVDGLPFWLELKITKTHRLNISAHQVSWNHAYSRAGGVSFFLVEVISGNRIEGRGADNLYLFAGDRGRELAENGLKSGIPGSGSGSGPSTIVPCLLSGSVGSGFLDGLLSVVRGRVGT